MKISRIIKRIKKNFIKTTNLEKTETIKNKTLQKKDFSEDFKFPLKLEGIQKIPDKKNSFIYNQILSYSKLSESWILDHLQKIYFGSLYSIIEKDEEFLSEYLEKNLKEKILKSVKEIEKNNFKLKVEEDIKGNYGEPIPTSIDIIDSVFVKGLNLEREKNNKVNNYHIWNDIKEMGIIIYSDKKLQNPDNFIGKVEDLEDIHESSRIAILRVLVKIKSSKIIKAFDPNGEEIVIPLKKKSWDHLVLFESELKCPKVFSNRNKLENYQEWLGKFKMGKWIISDFDHYMLGNPLFEDDMRARDLDQEVFRGSKIDPNVSFNIRN